MQRFIRRLAWQNLSVRAKTSLMFVLQVILIGFITAASLLALNTIRVRMETTVATTLELHALAQSLRLTADSLQRVETRLVEEYDQPGFWSITPQLRLNYNQLVEEATAEASQMVSLSAQLDDPTTQQGITVAVRAFQSSLVPAQEEFTQTLDLVADLAEPYRGALALLEQQGELLEDYTFLQANVNLYSHFLLMRSRQVALVTSGSEEDLTAFHQAADEYLRIYTETIPPSIQVGEIPATLENYVQQADEVVELIGRVELSHQVSQTSLTYVRGASSRLGNITEAQVNAQLEGIRRVQQTALVVLLMGVVLTLAVGAVLTYLFGRSFVRSINPLLDTASRLESGDLRARVETRGEDEFSRLALSFNAMAVQLEGLVGGLEQRVAERTRDLSITAEIGQSVVALHDPRDLMNEIVELIRRRFGFYHAQVFLLDDARENANLVASTGTAGRELLVRKHSLPVGSQSVIGQVAAQGTPVIALDTDISAVHRKNELLPDTRSEMALPMRIGDHVIGALDVQSVAPNAFDEDDVAIFQTMADQLAVALENARLHAQLADMGTRMEFMQRRMTAETWQAYRTQTRAPNAPLGYQISEDNIEPHEGSGVPAPMNDAIRSGRIIATSDGEDEIDLAIPIRVRGEVIGAFGFSGEALRDLSEDDLALLEAVTDRVGLTLENLRLVEQTARRAEYEQIVNAITAKIVGSTDVNHILQTTVTELGRILRAPQTSVQLRRESMGEGSSDE